MSLKWCAQKSHLDTLLRSTELVVTRTQKCVDVEGHHCEHSVRQESTLNFLNWTLGFFIPES